MTNSKLTVNLSYLLFFMFGLLIFGIQSDLLNFGLKLTLVVVNSMVAVALLFTLIFLFSPLKVNKVTPKQPTVNDNTKLATKLIFLFTDLSILFWLGLQNKPELAWIFFLVVLSLILRLLSAVAHFLLKKKLKNLTQI